MKNKMFSALVLPLFVFANAANACTFSWHHYGASQTYDRIKEKIGKAITDDYCRKYNATHQIVILTDEYVDSRRALAHVSVGLRKRGSNSIPVSRFSAYKFEDGNYVIAKGYELAASLAVDSVMDVMSDIDSYAK